MTVPDGPVPELDLSRMRRLEDAVPRAVLAVLGEGLEPHRLPRQSHGATRRPHHRRSCRRTSSASYPGRTGFRRRGRPGPCTSTHTPIHPRRYQVHRRARRQVPKAARARPGGNHRPDRPRRGSASARMRSPTRARRRTARGPRALPARGPGRPVGSSRRRAPIAPRPRRSARRPRQLRRACSAGCRPRRPVRWVGRRSLRAAPALGRRWARAGPMRRRRSRGGLRR